MIYEERKQYRPAREAYLLHSVERGNDGAMMAEEAQLGEYNGLSVQSDMLVSRSHMSANGMLWCWWGPVAVYVADAGFGDCVWGLVMIAGRHCDVLNSWSHGCVCACV